MNISNYKFVISSMSDMDVPSRNVNTDVSLQAMVNENININNYTSKISELYMTYMAIDPKTRSFRPDKKFWRWKNGEFEFFINVPDYEAFCKATENEARTIIALLFLKGIDRFLSKRKDINTKQLLADLVQLFLTENIISQQALTASANA